MTRQKSLLLRIFLVVAVMILAPSLLTFILFFRTVPDRMEKQAEANADFYIEQVASTVQNSMELTRDIAFNSIADKVLRQTMQDTDQSLVTVGRSALERIVGSVTVFQSTWNQHALNTVYLFRRDRQFISYSPKGAYVQEQQRLHRIYEETPELSSTKTLFRPDDAVDGKIYFLLDYKNFDNLDLLGKLIVELNAETMMGSADLIRLYADTCLALTDASGQLLYGQGEELPILLNSSESPPENVAEYMQGATSKRQDRYYHVSRQIGDYQLRLDVFIPLRSIYNLVWETNQIYGTFCVLILLLTILVAAMTYFTLLDPLQNMEGILGRIAVSDYSARMPKSKYRELARLETAFNHMADNLDSSFQDAYQKGIQLQESESRLLAAQINPHFVFNVLESINMRCVDAGLKDISRMVTDLAQLLRGNIGISSGNQKISIEQELTYVRYYLDLQQSRFGAALTYSVEYEDEDILQYLLPRLTIQPLVENAIVHGLEPRSGLGSVTVRLWEEGESVYVRVADDGVGFDSAQLDLSETAAADEKHNHIALTNILRRLRLLYGERAGLNLSSQPNGGTTVLLFIPIDRKDV